MVKTTKEKIEVMQAYEEGKQVECRYANRDVHSDTWCVLHNPDWNWETFDYRVKEEHKKTWLEEYLDINCDSKIEAHNSKIDIENVCKQILEEMENRALSCVSATTLRNIFKYLGIE